jgi:hypothetical protein
MNANQNNSTLEHSQKLKGMSVVESWIIEGENDKSKNYGFDLPQGTWMISMKVNNDEIWNKVKLGEVKGFSIEGYFADRYEMNSKNIDMKEKAMVEKIKELITKSELKSNKVNLGLIQDYDKLFEQATKNYDIFLKSDLLIKPNLDKAQQEATKALNALKKYIVEIESAKKMGDTLKQTAKDLGIDLKESKLRSVHNIESLQKINMNDLQTWIKSYTDFIKIQEPIGE